MAPRPPACTGQSSCLSHTITAAAPPDDLRQALEAITRTS
jgi:hypothetical protein